MDTPRIYFLTILETKVPPVFLLLPAPPPYTGLPFPQALRKLPEGWSMRLPTMGWTGREGSEGMGAGAPGSICGTDGKEERELLWPWVSKMRWGENLRHTVLTVALKERLVLGTEE